MANYLCSSRCRHCAYFCGPEWTSDYIDEASARRALQAVKRGGCRSVHIGGGEPFLGGERLCALLQWCRDEGVAVEYVETNSSWFTNAESARHRLEELMDAGLRTLLISMSPFHNEFIPWRKVDGVLGACRETGMGVFPWTEELGRDVSRLDPAVAHSMEEYEERLGPGYLPRIPDRYWISPRGRAIATFRPFGAELTADQAASQAGDGCRELLDTSHFHVDLYGNFIPGVCTGLAVSISDTGNALDRGRYRFITTLMDGGLRELLEVARDEFGYAPDRGFSGKCDLCYDIRSHLAIGCGVDAEDLRPVELYRRME